MSGSGIVYSVDYVSDKDNTAVWRIWLRNGPGNAEARATIEHNRTVISDIPAQIAVNVPWTTYVPVHVGDTVRWDAHHVYCGSQTLHKVGFEYDPNAPLSPP